MLTASEIRKYLTSGIFGDDKSLDSTSEIDNAVISVVKKLDEGDDGSVSISDIDLHLMNLDALLNLEETVDWVKYAVQVRGTILAREGQNDGNGVGCEGSRRNDLKFNRFRLTFRELKNFYRIQDSKPKFGSSSLISV